jgi:hypothetical protein
MALAETHEFCRSGRRNAGPAQRVTREEALRMWTRDAGRVLGWPDVGTLLPGNHADLNVIAKNRCCAQGRACDVDDFRVQSVLLIEADIFGDIPDRVGAAQRRVRKSQPFLSPYSVLTGTH